MSSRRSPPPPPTTSSSSPQYGTFPAPTSGSQPTTVHHTSTTMAALDWLQNIGSVKLKNTGAVARDHLANERTFLAWLRTSLTFASIGVAVAQFFKLQTADSNNDVHLPFTIRRLSTILGGLFVSAGMLIVIFAVWRYFSTQHYLQQGKFPASRGLALVTFGLTFALIAITFGTLLTVASKSHDI